MKDFKPEITDHREYLKFVGVFVAVFAVMFSAGYFMYPDGKYGEDFDIRVDSENPEANVSFDGRNTKMVFENGNKSIVNGNITQEIDFEGRRNDIFAVDDKVYMFYFDSGEDQLRLLRIEEL
jgi:hypothetical protein